MAKLTAAQALERLHRISGWELDGEAIQRQFAFKDFADAVAFVVRIGFAAEAADHHPDILINYRRVTLTYTTHSAGGLTDKDFAGAEEAARIAARLQPPAIAAD